MKEKNISSICPDKQILYLIDTFSLFVGADGQILGLPHTVLDIVLGYLSVDDLVSVSLSCSILNECVNNFIRIECQPQRLKALECVHLMLEVSKPQEANLNVSDMDRFLSLENTNKLYKKLSVDGTVLERKESIYLLRQREYVINYTDMVLSGKWEGTYDQYGEHFPFYMILQFNHCTGVICGYCKDNPGQRGLDFSVITGSYEGNTIRFDKQYRGQSSHTINYDGNIRYVDGEWRVEGLYWQRNDFQMVRIISK